jgi:amino acid transporter
MAVASGGASTGATGQLGERKLTTIHAIGQSLAIGPIFSAAVLTGVIATQAGFAAPASVVLGSLGALALGYVVTLYARRYAGAGAIYEYLTHGAHPTVGVFSSGLYFLGMCWLGAGGVFIILGIQLHDFGVIHLYDLDIPWWIWGAVFALIVFAINHYGIRLAVRAQLVLAAISAVPLIFLAIVIIAKGGDAGNTLQAFNPWHQGWNAVFHGILIAVTLFIGFELAASLGEETAEPRRAIPVAVLSTIAITAVFYILVSYSADIGFGEANVNKGGGDWAALGPSALGSLGTRYVGSWLGTVIDFVVILDTIAVALAFTVGAARGFFALGRDRLLPGAVATTSTRNTPLGGNLICLASALLFLLWAGVTSYGDPLQLPNELGAFFITANAGSFCVELIYLFLAIAAFRLAFDKVRGSASSLPQWVVAIILIVALLTPIAAYYGALHPWPVYPLNRAIYFALGTAAISLIWFLVLQFTQPEKVRNAAMHAAEHEGVPALDEPLEGHGQELPTA